MNLSFLHKAIKEIYPNINGGYIFWSKQPDNGKDFDDIKDGLFWNNPDFEKPSWELIEEKINQLELEEVRQSKIEEIKSIRDKENILPITDQQAQILDQYGSPTGQSSYFVFYTNRHATNPQSDPSVILTSVIVMNQTLPYSSKDLEGNKITIALTPTIARSIAAHLALRNNNNYKLSDKIESLIKISSSIEEINQFTWNAEYLEE